MSTGISFFKKLNTEVRSEFLLSFTEICQRHTVYIVVDHLIKSGPERQGSAGIFSGAVVGFRFQTGYRSQRAFGDTQNIPCCIVPRRSCEPIAAGRAPGTFQKTVFLKKGDDLLQIFQRNVLSLSLIHI